MLVYQRVPGLAGWSRQDSFQLRYKWLKNGCRYNYGSWGTIMFFSINGDLSSDDYQCGSTIMGLIYQCEH